MATPLAGASVERGIRDGWRNIFGGRPPSILQDLGCRSKSNPGIRTTYRSNHQKTDQVVSDHQLKSRYRTMPKRSPPVRVTLKFCGPVIEQSPAQARKNESERPSIRVRCTGNRKIHRGIERSLSMIPSELCREWCHRRLGSPKIGSRMRRMMGLAAS